MENAIIGKIFLVADFLFSLFQYSINFEFIQLLPNVSIQTSPIVTWNKLYPERFITKAIKKQREKKASLFETKFNFFPFKLTVIFILGKTADADAIPKKLKNVDDAIIESDEDDN